MDAHTQATKDWLETRFRQCDQDGIYLAHQPIYGYRKGHCESRLFERYVITYKLLKYLSALQCETLLDVGGAEGYKAFLATQLLHVKAVSSDLSEEACKRAREIFHLEARSAEIHNLPFADGSFDVVTCSETLEHVVDYQGALRELMRVARKAVVLTVPHDPPADIERWKRNPPPHAHIHAFNPHTLDYLKAEGCQVFSRKMVCPFFKIPSFILEASPHKVEEARYSRALVKVYNALVPFLQKVIVPPLRLIMGRHYESFMIHLDDRVANWFGLYDGILFVILKDHSLAPLRPQRISMRKIFAASVPFYHLPS